MDKKAVSHINFAVGLEVQNCLSSLSRLPLSTYPEYEHKYSNAIQEIATSIRSAQHCLSVTLRLQKQQKRNVTHAKFVPIIIDIAVHLDHSASSFDLSQNSKLLKANCFAQLTVLLCCNLCHTSSLQFLGAAYAKHRLKRTEQFATRHLYK